MVSRFSFFSPRVCRREINVFSQALLVPAVRFLGADDLPDMSVVIITTVFTFGFNRCLNLGEDWRVIALLSLSFSFVQRIGEGEREGKNPNSYIGPDISRLGFQVGFSPL